ncbi:cyclic pyranopterin phosphate synthase [Chitinophaga dinghuensis]|uniref:GTP 3',8-cyclase n=1 Tax=Chitinophaga dinghuensis TaxID=1539050 RepID=A0A327VVH3_9BACT|nr:GTP 3',8-cyclase MoaA [Chitinophaga dinghuensis]RAJ75191.1 cyclic pyranopterin phosphate synthase [Chitinophaga dinghuensis]
MLQDPHGRIINYVRLSVTDRCNLRCTYCMPEQMKFEQQGNLLTDDEIIRLLKMLAYDGVSKVRITGGEPFMRPNLLSLLEKIKNIDGITDIAITTNGVLTKSFIPALCDLGIQQVNLSLDTLQANRFERITRRNKFAAVMDCFHTMLQHDMQVKINTVVMDQVNTDEITAFAALTELKKVSVRFIEEMPFNGQQKEFSGINWHYQRILDTIREQYELVKIPDLPHATSLNYQIPGFSGTVGVIPAYSRTFCGTCNRLRISATGSIKTCLYGNNMLNVRDLLRQPLFRDMHIRSGIQAAITERFKDGFEAEKNFLEDVKESMSIIGG